VTSAFPGPSSGFAQARGAVARSRPAPAGAAATWGWVPRA